MASRWSPGALFDIGRRVGLLDPRRVPSVAASTARWGPTVAALYASAALSSPRRAAVVDDHGTLSYADLDRRSTQAAKGLRHIGIEAGASIGVACRNHADFVEITVAAAKAGLRCIYLNTGFAAPQMAEVLRREDVAGVAVDSALLHLLDDSDIEGPIVVTGGGLVDGETLGGRAQALAEVRDLGRRRPPLLASMPIAPVLLTSGTTGTPKGARRGNRADPSAATGIIEQIPYRHDDVMAVTSPLFHAWGLAQMTLAAGLGATVVLAESFDPDETLARIERERVTVLAVVPAILQRLLASPMLDSTDLSSLRIVASSGSALPVPVVEAWLDRVGPNLYNLYGSTEVGQATLATPDDLAHAPSTAGRVMRGSTVRILDESGAEVATGSIGRIFVGNGAQFDGYTGGGGKEVVDGLMSSGDVGYVDDGGLLFVTGRADDMIVSGGENVFPREVEDLLLAHPAVADVAVVGVADDDFGQRLAAHIVKEPGRKITKKQVRELVGANLARHKVPRDVHFVDELPRTATGKIRRSRL
jgi:acyl-CoA synthetase (AMP-forming)/AMP-acid ligase II